MTINSNLQIDLDQQPRVEELIFLDHIEQFCRNFIVASRCDRWLGLFRSNSSNLFRDSSKLIQHLDNSRCNKVLPANISSISKRGVFFEFFHPAVWLDLPNALQAGLGIDAIYSVIPGKLVYLFFHEGAILECSLSSSD